MGTSSRLSGLTIRPSVSSVTAPSRGPSSASPRTTGEGALVPSTSIQHADTGRAITPPSARVNSTVRCGRSRKRLQTLRGSTVYTAPVSTRKRRRTGGPLLLRLTRALTKETPTGPRLTIAIAGGPAPRDAFDPSIPPAGRPGEIGRASCRERVYSG